MHNVLFNRSTNFVTGLNREKMTYEYEVNLPFDIQLSKSVQESTDNQIQKTTPEGLPLFKTNIQINPLTNEETWTETIESQIVTKTQIVTNTYQIADPIKTTTQTITNPDGTTSTVQVPVYNTLTTQSEIPIEWQDLEPILIPEIISKAVTINESMFSFDYNEVLEAKKQAINNNSLYKLFFYDEDFLSSDLILFGISTGDGLLVFYPNSSITTPILPLPKTTDIIAIYQESQNSGLVFEVNDTVVTFNDSIGKVKFPFHTNQVTIKVSNPTNKNLELYALGGMC